MRRPKVRIHAVRVQLDPRHLKFLHALDVDDVVLLANVKGPLPPVLVCAEFGTLWLYDGNHRVASALIKRSEYIEAYLFSAAERDEVVKRYFAGNEPEDAHKLDPYITLPDGSSYESKNIRT